MNDGKSTRSVIESYRKRRRQNQTFIVWGGAVLLVLIGIILLVVWLTGPSKPLNTLFATETPTPTLTFTPTATSIPTETPTITATFTETPTATRSAPYTYTVQEGDFLATIAEKENLGPDGVALILLLNPYDETNFTGIDPTTQIVYPGQEILLPFPGMPLPTSTPIPVDLARGTRITYTVQAGDTLAGIASLFNSTMDDIIAANETLEDPNAIYVGQQLIIPANLVTPTATFPPTSTAAAGTPSATATP